MITRDLLKSWKPCTSGYRRFCELFPDGAQLDQALDGLIADGHEDWAYWLFDKCRRDGLFTDITSKGHRNSGDGNSGHRNSGDWNSGHRNSGHRNSGYGNSGHRNSGDGNSGDGNSGYGNSGDWNSGHRNSGYGNSGDWNSGDWNSGYFNVGTPETVLVFGKPCAVDAWYAAYKPAFLNFSLTVWRDSKDMTDAEKSANPFHIITGGILITIGYKEAFTASWLAADPDDRMRVMDLPNFDAQMFYDISGIDLRGVTRAGVRQEGNY